ncbi:MAG: response regulator [Hydrogenovibrio sp.]
MAHLLAVDDADVIRNMLKITFKTQPDWTVDLASSMSEALEHTRRTHYDLFVIDYLMPENTGLELVRHLREQAEYEHTPILMLTAETDPCIKEQAKSLHVSAWVIKPFQPLTLIGAVKRLLTQTVDNN